MSAPELLSWLRSTIEGDKAAAEALDGETWTAVKVNGDWHIQTSQDQAFGGDVEWGELDPREAALIAAHDPRDTIARCESDLALLDEHEPIPCSCVKCQHPYEGNAAETVCMSCSSKLWPCRTVRLLASGRRHREGFNPDWVSG